MQEIRNMTENLPKVDELYITISEKNPNIRDNREETHLIKNIPGIKLELYKHQKVLVQQLIDIINRGYIECQSKKYFTKNLWLKSSIGTGKSLCLLSMLQYFKNTGYNTLKLTVPVKMNVLSMIKASDIFFNQAPFNKNGLYEKMHNLNYYNFDITKQQGYLINGEGQTITYTSHRKQSLIFVQDQVFKQFEEYIKQQTSLTYYPIQNPVDFIGFLLKEPTNDIILWDVDTINVSSIFLMMKDYIKQYEKDSTKILQHLDKLQLEYPNVNGFNTFWIQYQKNHKNKPFTFVAFDDFDMIQMQSFYPIDSLWNIFVGSTMISRPNENTNPCTNFILNKHLNYLSGFRINEKQLQEILKLPKNNVKNVVCSTPGKIWMQFKMLQYIQKIFTVIAQPETLKDKDNSIKLQSREFNNTVFSEIIGNKTTFVNLFEILKLHGLIFNSINYSPDIILDIINNIKMYCFGEVIVQNAKRQNLTDDQLNQQMNQFVIPYIYQDIDQTFQEKLYAHPNYKQIIEKITNMPFKLEDQDIVLNKIEDPFVENEKLDTNCYITRCCCQPFNKQHLNDIVYYANNTRYCAFCQKQIEDLNHHVFDIAKQQYIQINKIEARNHDKSYIQYDNLSKQQYMYKLILQSFQTKKLMIISKKQLSEYTLKNLYQPKELSGDELKKLSLEEQVKYIIDYTRQINIYQVGDILRNYPELHRQEAMKYTNHLFRNHIISGDVFNLIQKYDLTSETYPDLTIVNSLHQIIGANMTHIDIFIFIDVPEQSEEIYQIVGRSRRIGRAQDNTIESYFFYYPLQQRVQLKN